MKKLTLIFALLTFVSFIGNAQTLSWQFANYEVINAGSQLQFDIEVKADVGGTYHRDLQVYFDYNTLGFGSDIVANAKVTVADLTLMENHYFVVNSADNTGSKFAVITEASNEMTEWASATYYNEMTTTFQGLLRITIDIDDNTETAGIAFDETLMNGGQYYQDDMSTDPIKYTDPCFYDNNLSGNKLSTVYGNVTYANGSSSALSEVTVKLMDGVVEVASDVTDSNGDYNISDIDDGGYTLESTTVKAWGGLTMNDVQLARQHVVDPLVTLTGMHYFAGDVDEDGYILMNDVMAMWQEQTGTPPGFVHFWIFEEPGVTVTSGVGTQSFQGICSGDTDGSYAP